MAKDYYEGIPRGLESPAYDAYAMTTDDTTIIPTRALYVGVAGNVVAVMVGGSQVTFSNLPIGIHPLRVKEIKATGTTATNMVGLY